MAYIKKPRLIKLTFYISIIFFISFSSNACEKGLLIEKYKKTDFENIYSGNVYLSSQLQVDNFASQLYTGINGSLYISGTDINSLTALSSIEFIQNELTINFNHSLTNLDGLNGLITVGSLKIQNNNSLVTIDGLHSITDVNSSLTISNNNQLFSINGLQSINTIGGNFTVKDNLLLETLNGINSISSIGGNLTLSNCKLNLNDNLFPNLTSINGYLEITNFSNLNYIMNSFTIY